jgi:hypothetical protein
MNRISLALFTVAFVLLVVGIWWILPAAALIVAAVLLVAAGVLVVDIDAKTKAKAEQ